MRELVRLPDFPGLGPNAKTDDHADRRNTRIVGAVLEVKQEVPDES